jgi:hypothetical protein
MTCRRRAGSSRRSQRIQLAGAVSGTPSGSFRNPTWRNCRTRWMPNLSYCHSGCGRDTMEPAFLELAGPRPAPSRPRRLLGQDDPPVAVAYTRPLLIGSRRMSWSRQRKSEVRWSGDIGRHLGGRACVHEPRCTRPGKRHRRRTGQTAGRSRRHRIRSADRRQYDDDILASGGTGPTAAAAAAPALGKRPLRLNIIMT